VELDLSKGDIAASRSVVAIASGLAGRRFDGIDDVVEAVNGDSLFGAELLLALEDAYGVEIDVERVWFDPAALEALAENGPRQ